MFLEKQHYTITIPILTWQNQIDKTCTLDILIQALITLIVSISI